MSQKDEFKKSLENEIEQCDDFLKKAKDIADIVPLVVEHKKEAEAKLVFVDNVPEPIMAERGGILFVFQKHDEEQLNSYLPELPGITPEGRRYLASGSSDSSEYFDIVQTYRRADLQPYNASGEFFTKTDIESLDKVIVVFSELADEKAKKKTLPPLLNKINNDLGEKYKVAQDSYDKATNGIVGVDQSAIQLRDVIEQLWGGLVKAVREKDPRKYKGVELNLDVKGKGIAVECLAPDQVNKQKLTLLLDSMSTIKAQISDSEFGKNPLNTDVEKLTEIYTKWKLVVTDIVDFVVLNVGLEENLD